MQVLADAREEEKEPETTVTSHAGAEKPDEMMVGYMFSTGYKDATPYDFIIDHDTGETVKGSKVWSIARHDLRPGIETATLPPLMIWKMGRWLSEFAIMDEPLDNVRPNPRHGKEPEKGWAFNVWVTHGEGTPGGNSFRAYLLPDVIAEACVTKDDIPKHPLLWPKTLKDGKAESFAGDTHDWWSKSPGQHSAEFYKASWHLITHGEIKNVAWANRLTELAKKPWSIMSGSSGYSSPGSAVKVPPVTKAVSAPKTTQSTLPAGVRFRCAACGHWYKESELPAHAKVCPGQDSQGFSDWAIMCDKECGCEYLAGFPAAESVAGIKTLDHVATCKPGFPRPKEEVKTVSETTEEATPEETPETPEETSEATEEAEATTTA